MVQAVLRNLARMTVTSTGTGTITLNAAVPGFLTFDLAGCSTVSSGETVFYAINDTNQSEIGTGTYISSALTLSRTPLDSTNGGAAIDATLASQVFITPPTDAFNGRLIQTTEFTASGTYNKPSWLRFAVVHVVGAGGGGGSAISTAAAGSNAGSGGSGAAAGMSIVLSSVMASSETVTIGGGGTGGSTAGVAASSGGTTSFGTIVTADGGFAGVNSTDAGTGSASITNAANGNITATADVAFLGGAAGNGLGLTSLSVAISGTGGPGGGPFGGGPRRGLVATVAGSFAGSAGVRGGGGSGAANRGSSAGSAGGAGGDGYCILFEYA